MKKFLGFLFAVCLVAMLIVTPIGALAEGQDVDIDMGGPRVKLTDPGDINDDDSVNLKDLVVLAQVQAGWENVNHRAEAVDTNGDGYFTLADVTHFAQYLAGWGVELGQYEYVA